MKEHGIAKAASAVLIVTIFSKVIGFIESAVVAACFGTSSQIDMFYMANSISNRFVFTIFSGLAVVGITMYNAAVQKGGKKQGDRFVSALIKVVIPLAVCVMIIILLFSPCIANIMASNYGTSNRELLILYLRELSIIAIFYSLMTIFTAILNANKLFIPGAFIGIIQNGIIILFVVFTSNNIGVDSVVIGFIVSYLFQTVFLYVCSRQVFKYRKSLLSKDIDVKQIVILILPLLLGEATAEINILVDQYLASKQGYGAVSALSYSETLNDAVTALFIQTVTSVLLSFFSKLAVEKKYDEMFVELKSILKTVTMVLIPVCIITVNFSTQIISVFFQRGTFNANSVRMTAYALMGYSIGFVFKTVMVITKRPFFAIENTKVPMIVGLITVIVNISLSILLGSVWGLFGITVSTSIAYLIASIIYIIMLHIYFPDQKWNDCVEFTYKVIIAGSICVLIVFFTKKYIIVESQFINLVIVTCISFFIYFIALIFLRTEEAFKLIKKISEFIFSKGRNK